MTAGSSVQMLLVFTAVIACVSCLDRRNDLYPFGPQHRDIRMDVGDDVSSNAVRLRTPITFYDQEYQTIYVNLNGMLTFDTDFPVYRSNLIVPFGYKMIAPFLADVDTRLSGNVYYRETGDPTLLQKAAEQIQHNFAEQDDFTPTSLFIVTWDGVGHYNEQYDQTNTFQAVIASDGRESFVAFLYPDNGIEWIRGDGKDAPVSEDAPGQAGFDAGDSRRYYTLPGSGNPDVVHLTSRSNVGVPGLWLYRVGDLQGNNIHSPDDEDEDVDYNIEADEDSLPGSRNGGTQSCARGGEQTCNTNAHCNDYPDAGGYCCECTSPFIGNGRECIRTDEAQRISGKLNGRVNGVVIDDVDLHSYVVTTDGRTYTAVSRIPASIGFALQGLYVTGSVLGFLFALPQQPGLRNGFSITGGQLNRTAVLQFSPGGETLTIRQSFLGQDAQGHMRMTTNVEGRVPDVGSAEAKVEVGDYQEEYRRISPGVLKSFSSHNFRAGPTQYRFTLDQTIDYVECRYRPLTDVDVVRVGVSRNFVVYTNSEQIVRYSQTNKVVAAAGVDPCREARCDSNADCVPQRDTYQCICKAGFEGTGQRCRDVDECNQIPGTCDTNAECFNTLGSYECRCYPGFVGDGRTCRQDGQSCDILRNCDRSARCEYDDNLGSYSCRCNEGYVGDGYSCVMRPAQQRDCSTRPDLCDRNAQCLYDTSSSQYVCRCGRGWEGNGQTCQRVDCRRNQGVCDPDARCERRGSESVCVCKPGYHGDGYQCSGLAERLTTSYLMYTQGMYIMQVPFRPTETDAGTQTLYIPGQTAVGIDVDCVSRYFYWTDISGKTVSRAKLDGTDSEVFLRDLGSPEGVAIDWISKNIYWTDSGRDEISVIRIDGSHRKNLFNEGLVNPRAIVVDPIRGFMFWTDWNRDEPKIERANMDGTERRTLISDELGLPNGLTIDYDTQQICWADAGTHKIECCSYDGRGRRIITQSAGYPFGLTFANGNLYWTDWDRQTMPNINKLSAQAPNEDLTLPLGANGRLYDVAVVKVTCPSGTNPCAYNNGGCRFLCLPTSKGGRTCACPDATDPEECNRIALL